MKKHVRILMVAVFTLFSILEMNTLVVQGRDLFFWLNSEGTASIVREYYHAPCLKLTTVIIPSTVRYEGKEYSVTTIGHGAFSGCSGLTSVSIPNSVKTICDGAFSGCSGLTSVTIPNSVTTMGDGAFGYCSGLTSVTMPNSVKYIHESAFSDCNYRLTSNC